MFDHNPFFEHFAANDPSPETLVRSQQRERTVPIPETLTPVPGYPQKLAVFKIAASRFWQVRCWVAGRTYRRSTQSQSLRMAQSFARQFYEQLMAKHHSESPGQGQLFPKRAAGKRGAGVGFGVGAASAAQDDALFESAEAVSASKAAGKSGRWHCVSGIGNGGGGERGRTGLVAAQEPWSSGR